MHRPGMLLAHARAAQCKIWNADPQQLRLSSPLPRTCQVRTLDRETGMSPQRNYQRSLYQCTYIKSPYTQSTFPVLLAPPQFQVNHGVTGIRRKYNGSTAPLQKKEHCFSFHHLPDKPKQGIYLSFKKKINKSNPTKKLLVLTRYQFLVFYPIYLETGRTVRKQRQPGHLPQAQHHFKLS